MFVSEGGGGDGERILGGAQGDADGREGRILSCFLCCARSCCRPCACMRKSHCVREPTPLQCPPVMPFPPLELCCLDYPPAPTPLRRPWRRNGSRKRRLRRRLGALNNSTLKGGMLDGSREVHCSV